MSSLEAELSEVKIQTHIVEQENLLLKDELEKLKQVRLLKKGPGEAGLTGQCGPGGLAFLATKCLFTESCQLACCLVKLRTHSTSLFIKAPTVKSLNKYCSSYVTML